MLKNKLLINSINRFYKLFHIEDIDNPNYYIQYHISILNDFDQLNSILYDIDEAIYESPVAYNSSDLKWLKKLYNKIQTAIEVLNTKHEQLANQLNNFFEDNGIFQTADSTDFRTQSGKAKWLDYLTDLDLGNKDIQQLKNYILNI